MPKPKSMLPHAQIKRIMERALVEKTVLIQCQERSAAQKFQHDFHSVRHMDRLQTTKVWPPDDPRHGTSPYDVLQTRIIERENFFWLEITSEPLTAAGVKVLGKDGKEIEL